MSTLPLANNLYLNNVHRVDWINDKEFSKEYPGVLRGIMHEGEYVDYLKRIEEAGHASGTIALIMIVPMLIVIFAFILLRILNNDLAMSIVMPLISFISFLGAAIIFFVKLDKNKKKAIKRVGIIIEEINQRYNPCGIRFTYVPEENKNPKHIDITMINPNDSQNYGPDPWAQMTYSGINNNNGTPSESQNQSNTSYTPYSPYSPYSPIPSAPPEQTTSINDSSSSSSAIITSTELPTIPTYPGDPTMFTVIE